MEPILYTTMDVSGNLEEVAEELEVTDQMISDLLYMRKLEQIKNIDLKKQLYIIIYTELRKDLNKQFYAFYNLMIKVLYIKFLQK